MYWPEYIKEGSRLIFREGRTKGIGRVSKIIPEDEEMGDIPSRKRTKKKTEDLVDNTNGGVTQKDVKEKDKDLKETKEKETKDKEKDEKKLKDKETIGTQDFKSEVKKISPSKSNLKKSY